MKVKIFGIIMAFILFFSFSIPSIESIEEEKVNGWWDNWSRDKNHNGIDDLIDEKIKLNSNEKISIFVDYDHHPTEKDIHRLLNLGFDISYVCKYIDTISVENVPISKIQLISKLPNIIMIEEQPKIIPLLDVSTRAVKARESGEYSPETAWELGYTGDGINIAILDTGVDDEHESLQGKFVAGVDFTDNSPWAARDGSANPDDRDGHGTHCAGIAMGIGGNEGKYKGVAHNSKLIDVKVMSDIGAGGYILQGIDWCVEHKDDDWGDDDPSNDGIYVLSISAGSFTSDDDGQSATSRAANTAVEHGLVVVAAIGNSGNDHQGISSPAAADNAIAVGAVDDQNSIHRSDDEIASYSNSGPREDDGDDDSMDELKPEIVAPGSNIYSAQHSRFGQQGVGYVENSGTSMSTPHVAGISALMLQANSDLKPLQLREIMKDTAEQRGEPYDVNLSDRYNELYGWGIIDAYEAVSFAKSGEIPTDLNCKINNPKEGENVSGIIEISGIASSSTSSIEKVEVKIDNSDWQEAIGTNSWAYVWDTTNVTDGNHAIQAKAISGENEAFDTINVIINNAGNTSTKGEDEKWFESDKNLIALSCVFIVIAVAVIIAWKRH